MAIATINQNFEVPGYAQVFLAAYPTAGFTGVTQADKLDSLWGLFYTDPDARKTLKAGVTEFANLDEAGLSGKLNAETVEINPQSGSKHPISFIDFGAELEGNFYDVDVEHLKDIMSSTAGAMTTTAAATGVAARSTLLIGGSVKLNKYVMMVRLQSGNGISGEFDHWLFPRIVFNIDTDLKFTKKEALSAKFKATALYDRTFTDPTTGKGIMALVDTVTGAAI